MIPKEIKYNLHYDHVRGDFLRPPYGTTSEKQPEIIWKDMTGAKSAYTAYRYVNSSTLAIPPPPPTHLHTHPSPPPQTGTPTDSKMVHPNLTKLMMNYKITKK